MYGVFSNGNRNLPKPIPERIREAREARGLQQDTFAEFLGITKQAVSRFESGLASPSGETMSRIIGITEQPPSFFVKSRERSASGINPFWRSLRRMELHHRKRMSRRLEWARDITSYLERFIDLPTLSLPDVDFDPDSQSFAAIEYVADSLREAWGLGRGPIRNLSTVLELNGTILINESVDCPDMDAVSCWQFGRPYILYSSDVISGPRNSFNLAHEIGHILLHSSVEVNSKNLKIIEIQANRFASSFLLPQETFSREVLGTSLDHFLFLKEKWGVAISAMAYRCKDLKIINSNQHSYIMRQMNLRRIRKKEPLDELFQIEKPTILGASIKMLIENNVQTRSQIKDALALNLEDIESICALSEGYLDSRIVQFVPKLRNKF